MSSQGANTNDLIRAQIALSNKKSVGLALVLAFFFGPLGLLYASVVGGIVMLILSLLIGIVTFGIGLILTWLISIIWAGVAVSGHNRKIDLAVVGEVTRRETL